MKRTKMAFSKRLLLLESLIVVYTTVEGFSLARLAVTANCRVAAVDRDDGDGGMGRLRRERRVLLQQGKGGEYRRRRGL